MATHIDGYSALTCSHAAMRGGVNSESRQVDGYVVVRDPFHPTCQRPPGGCFDDSLLVVLAGEAADSINTGWRDRPCLVGSTGAVPAFEWGRPTVAGGGGRQH
jgi:hypothetical protein